MEVKKSINRFKQFFFLVVFFLLTLLPINPVQASAIGISPPEISVPYILKGGSGSSQTIHLSTSDSSKDSYLRVEPRGDYAGYIEGPDTVFIPAGSQSADYTFNINPKDAAVDDYEVYLSFYQADPQTNETKGNFVTVISGATAIVRFAVTGEQILEYGVSNFNVKESETGIPLYLSYSVNNTGNVQWKPDRLAVTFQDADDQTNFQKVEINGESIPLTKAGSIEQANIKIDHTLIEGKYSAIAEFFYQEEKVAELTSQKFNIYPVGTLSQKGELLSLRTNKGEYAPGENIKLEALFQNTSDLTLTAALITEIYDAESSMVDLRRGQEVEIEPGQKIDLGEVFNLNDSGNYTLSSYVEYGNKKTSAQNVEISIIGQKSFFQSSNGSLLIIIIISAIIIIISVLIYHRRKNI